MEPQDFSTFTTRRKFIRQAACAALGTAALTNTIRDLRFINAAMAQSTPVDYKALVCIFIAGGNDANNLFIPTDPSEYANYATIRTPVLAIPNSDGGPATALALNSLNSDAHTYGLHPACPELRGMFNGTPVSVNGNTNSGKLAALFNTGTLVYPLTKAQYNSGSVAKPPQLFSHSDQVTQWQTSIPDRAPTTGWGGRCADLLDTLNPRNGNAAVLSLAISLAGANTFEVGGVVQQYAVGTGGVVSLNLNNFSAATARQAAFNNLIAVDEMQSNMLLQNYALALDHSLATGSSLSNSLANSLLLPSYFNVAANFPSIVVPNGGTTFSSNLMAQLKMVARIIDAGYRSAAQGGLGMKRQIFFCEVGGYDTHTGQTNNAGNNTANPAQVILGSQANLLAELSQSMNAFQAAMHKISLQYGDADFEKRVTAFTNSDFGRTFPSNALGSDHGWGSHHLVMGGAVNGQRTFGTWPTLAVGGPDDTSTGRWIPTTSVDQFAATLAKWFGVDDTKMSTVFPNLGRFNAPDLGFMS
ncbi:MAG: DUF1501 domain-containing protein [Verrucomicrobiota bacterium]|nr:DUF1501 domain-containing protein [Verrucomicrobiota bacterium]